MLKRRSPVGLGAALTRRRWRRAVALLWLAAFTPVDAHHSFFAEFDINQPFTMTGTVTKVEWANPHIHFVLEVVDRRGKVTEWIFSGAAASVLARQGVTETTIKTGETVKVDGWRAIDGSSSGAAGAVTLPNRKRIFVGPVQEPTPI